MMFAVDLTNEDGERTPRNRRGEGEAKRARRARGRSVRTVSLNHTMIEKIVIEIMRWKSLSGRERAKVNDEDVLSNTKKVTIMRRVVWDY